MSVNRNRQKLLYPTLYTTLLHCIAWFFSKTAWSFGKLPTLCLRGPCATSSETLSPFFITTWKRSLFRPRASYESSSGSIPNFEECLPHLKVAQQGKRREGDLRWALAKCAKLTCQSKHTSPHLCPWHQHRAELHWTAAAASLLFGTRNACPRWFAVAEAAIETLARPPTWHHAIAAHATQHKNGKQ